jgi:VanZ family protein
VIAASSPYGRLGHPVWLGLATATVLFAYSAVLLWPYDWEPAGYVENRAESLPQGGIRFPGPGIARTHAPPQWVAAAMRARELKVHLQVRSLAPEQTGPARIMTLSLDPGRRDFTIAQEKADLILRLRSPASDLNGTVDDAPVASVPNVFRSMRWRNIELRVGPGQLELSVDGRLAARRPLPEDPFENWNPSYAFALGNELTYNRPWLGEIRRAVVRAGSTEVDYARSSKLETPESFWLLWTPPRLIPLQYSSAGDLIRNIILFIPLGVLIAAWHGRRLGQPAWRAIFLLAAISASFETLQLFIPVRSPSIDDVIANTLGGSLGVLLVRWLRASAVGAAVHEGA